MAGGAIPHPSNSSDSAKTPDKTIYLLAGLLHTDIAIPVDEEVVSQFGFLMEDGLTLDHPNLNYLIIGWGSRAFYTNTKEYADIGFATTWKAVTGDTSVMHIQPAGPIDGIEGLVRIGLNERAFRELLKFMKKSFFHENDRPVPVPDATFGLGDIFYSGVGRFNIFKPCNVWTAEALRSAGVNTGIWTPTTFSLKIGHLLHN